MASESKVKVVPIAATDRERAARFLHQNLNDRLSAADWDASMSQPWDDAPANYGFMLTVGDDVVGVNLAFYSTRVIAGEHLRFCNIGALCVREDVREHAVRLIRAVLRQPSECFTDFSPSGNVVEIDRRLGFKQISTATAVLLNLGIPGRRGSTAVTDPAAFEATMTPEELVIYRDLRRSRAAKHLLIHDGLDHCYVIFRVDSRKRLRAFASLLFVSNPDLLAKNWSVLKRHVLTTHRIPFTLVELRMLACIPRTALVRPGRPKFFKGAIDEAKIDYLYSELTEVAW